MGFEGGQTPLYLRMRKEPGPPRGHKKVEYRLISMDMLNRLESNTTIDGKTLLAMGIMTRRNKKVKLYKVLANGVLNVTGLTVKAHAFSATARAMIEAQNGTCVLLSKTKQLSREDLIKRAFDWLHGPTLEEIVDKLPAKGSNTTVKPGKKKRLSRKYLRLVRNYMKRDKENAKIRKLVEENDTRQLNLYFKDLTFHDQ